MFVGDGPLATVLETKARRTDLEDRVRFVKGIEAEQREAAYVSADLFVLPTRAHQAWGLTVQQALAAGLPVLVSDRVGCRDDLVEEGKTGHVYPANQPDALAAGLLELAGDPQRRQRMAALATALARRFDAAAVAQTLADRILG